MTPGADQVAATAGVSLVMCNPSRGHRAYRAAGVMPNAVLDGRPAAGDAHRAAGTNCIPGVVPRD